VADGETRRVHVPHNGLLPEEIDGFKVPASYRDSLLDQPDNWHEFNQEPAKQQAKTTAAKADDEK
jgi:hypothetical protein